MQAAPSDYWLVKSEPDAYSWDDLVKDGTTQWTGVRNYQARNNLRAMKQGQLALYYHSQGPKTVVGVARITREAFPDPTATDGGDWVAVEIMPVTALQQHVSLAQIKEDPLLAQMALIRSSRLSVQPVTADEFNRVLRLGLTPHP